MLISSPPVARSWSARATPAGAQACLEHFERVVLPGLRRLAGHRGALVLRRVDRGEVEITVLTLWASREVVETEARAALTTFNIRAVHFELALHAEP